MLETKVLDHGLVRLVDTMPKMGQEGMLGDVSIVRAARISHDAAWRAGENEEADIKLLRRLWSGQPSSYTGPLPELPKHSTPFEAVTMTFEIMAPIFVFRQWHRHRTQSYNELSARYRELPETFYVPAQDQIGSQSTANKQGRQPGDIDLEQRRAVETGMYVEHCQHAFRIYRNLLANGWPRELARSVLPVSTYSHMFTTMNLLNFFKFANLRADKHAQYEIRVYAEAMIGMVGMLAPVATSLFLEAIMPPEVHEMVDDG